MTEIVIFDRSDVVLLGEIDFDPFLTSAKYFTPRILVKHSNNNQNLALSKNTWNLSFETYKTSKKKIALLDVV